MGDETGEGGRRRGEGGRVEEREEEGWGKRGRGVEEKERGGGRGEGKGKEESGWRMRRISFRHRARGESFVVCYHFVLIRIAGVLNRSQMHKLLNRDKHSRCSLSSLVFAIDYHFRS